MDRIDETVTAGTTEIWEFDNSAGADYAPHALTWRAFSSGYLA
jgi:hypothetical protein